MIQYDPFFLDHHIYGSMKKTTLKRHRWCEKSTSWGSLWPPGRRSAAWTPASCYRYRWKDLDLWIQWSWSPQGGRLKKLCFFNYICFPSFWMIESRNDGRGGFFGYDSYDNHTQTPFMTYMVRCLTFWFQPFGAAPVLGRKHRESSKEAPDLWKWVPWDFWASWPFSSVPAFWTTLDSGIPLLFHVENRWFPWIIAGSRGQKSLVGKARHLSWQEFWSSLITDSDGVEAKCGGNDSDQWNDGFSVFLQVGLPAHLPWKHGRKFICPTAAALGAKSPELILAFLGKPEGTKGVESCDAGAFWGRQSQRPILKYENDSTWMFVQLTDIGWSTASDFPRFQASRCKHICGQHRSIAWRTCMPLVSIHLWWICDDDGDDGWWWWWWWWWWWNCLLVGV